MFLFDGIVCFLLIGLNDIGFSSVVGNLEQIFALFLYYAQIPECPSALVPEYPKCLSVQVP